MTRANELGDAVALLLLQKIMEGMENGRIADIKAARAEVEAAIAEFNNRRLHDGSNHISDLVGKMILEIGSLREKVAKCELQLAECHSRAEALKEETTQIVARTEACSLLVDQQQKENDKVRAAMEEMKANISALPPPHHAPAPSPVGSASYPAPSRTAIVSFPGGPRTVTIHPPDSPNYQSTVRDEKGDIVISLKGGKPLRREGAFRGLIEDIDWRRIHCVYGRGPDVDGPRPVSPTSCWPDRSQPSSVPAASRSASDIIARQCQLSVSIQTDTFGRVLPADHLVYAKSPSLPTGMSSSEPFENPHSGSSAKPDAPTSYSAPSSPSAGRGQKRTRRGDEDEDAHEAREDLLAVQDPKTPTLVNRKASQTLEGPVKRKKPRHTASSEAASASPLARSYSVFDLTRTV